MKFSNLVILSIIVLFIGLFSNSVNCEKELSHIVKKCPRNSIKDDPFKLNVTMHITQVATFTVKSFQDVYISGGCCELSQPQETVFTFGYGFEPKTNLGEIYQGVKLTGNLSYKKDGKEIKKEDVSFILNKVVANGSYVLRIFK